MRLRRKEKADEWRKTPCEAQTPRRNKAQIKISIFFPQGKKEGYDFQKVSSWRGGKPNSFVSTALSEIVKMLTSLGFPGGTSGEEPTCQCRRCKRWEFDPWVGKIPRRRAQKPTPVFLAGESHGQRSLESTRHQSIGSQRVGQDWSDFALKQLTSLTLLKVL